MIMKKCSRGSSRGMEGGRERERDACTPGACMRILLYVRCKHLHASTHDANALHTSIVTHDTHDSIAYGGVRIFIQILRSMYGYTGTVCSIIRKSKRVVNNPRVHEGLIL